MGNIAKLRMSAMFRAVRDLALDLLGPRGMLHAYDDSPVAGDDDPQATMLTALSLWSPAPSIYGGTDEIQRNILGERVLGLPRDGHDDSSVPFRELPKNV